MVPLLPSPDVRPSPIPSTAAVSVLSDAAFDERWQAWLARGASHERAVLRRMRMAAPVLAVIAALLLYWLVLGAPAGTP